MGVGFIAYIIIGILAGWIAGLIVKGKGFGILGDMLVGIVGSLIGGYVFQIFGVNTYGFWATLITSIVGALILLGIVYLVRGGKNIGTAR